MISSLRSRLTLAGLRVVGLGAAVVGTPLLLGGIACWVVYDACERAAQPRPRTDQ